LSVLKPASTQFPCSEDGSFDLGCSQTARCW